MEQLNSHYSDDNDPYEEINLITLRLISPDEEKSKSSEPLTVDTSILKRRIKELKVEDSYLKYSDLIDILVILLLSGRNSWSARYIQASWSS